MLFGWRGKLACTVRQQPPPDCVTISSSLSPRTDRQLRSCTAPQLHSIQPFHLRHAPTIMPNQAESGGQMHCTGQWPMKIYGQIQNERERDFVFEQNMSFLFYCPKMVKNAAKAATITLFYFGFCGDLCVTKVGKTGGLLLLARQCGFTVNAVKSSPPVGSHTRGRLNDISLLP